MNLFKGKIKKLLIFAKAHKIITSLIIVLILAMGFFLRPKPSQPILTQKVERDTFTRSISITGSVDAQRKADLTFPTAGKLVFLSANEGDIVEDGQVIASIDQEKLRATLRQAEQDFNAAKAVVEQVYNQTGRKSDLSFSEKVTQTAAEAKQNQAYDNMRKAQTDIQQANIIAPFSGLLTRADIKNVGINVTTTTVFTVTDPSSLDFKMEVDEADISSIRPGLAVDVSLDSYPDRTLHLVVEDVDFVTHITSTGGNAFNVKAKISDNSGLMYRVGMNGNAEIIIEKKRNVISVPLSAITETDKAYVKKGQKFEKKNLKLGAHNDTSVEVISGLSEGEIIALEPTTLPKNQIKQ